MCAKHKRKKVQSSEQKAKRAAKIQKRKDDKNRLNDTNHLASRFVLGEYESLITSLLNDAHYAQISNRGKLASLRQHAEVLIRRIFDLGSGIPLTLGQVRADSKNAIIADGLSKMNGDLAEYLIEVTNEIRVLGNQGSHTQYTAEFTDDDILTAENAILNLYSILFIDFFEQINIGLNTNPRLLSAFSFLPPVVRYKTWNYLFKQQPNNITVADKLCLAIIKTKNKKAACDWLKNNRKIIEQVPFPTASEIQEYKDIHRVETAPGVYEIRLTLDFDNYNNLFSLLHDKIAAAETTVNESGKMYDSFETAKRYYEAYRSSLGKDTGEEFERLLSLLDFVYLGRKSETSERFIENAKQGDPKSQLTLGFAYLTGQGVSQDYGEAIKWIQKAAQQDYVPAQFVLGGMYLDGQGVPQDYSKAIKWIQKAAQQDYVPAQFGLGAMYLAAQGVPQDYSKAIKWFQKAAQQGDVDAQRTLGQLYLTGVGVPQNYSEAARWFRKAARQGDAEAQSTLGTLYSEGMGVSKDNSEALKWLYEAANQGDPTAQFNLGVMFENGCGVHQNDKIAARWHQAAAMQGEPHAQCSLGCCYREGRGVPKDLHKSIEWTLKAAEQGEIHAQFNMSIYYAEGRGVPKDAVKAADWTRKAAEQGFMRAQANLGSMYFRGNGVEQDYAKAAEWYKKAALQGDPVYEYIFAYFLCKGVGVPRDNQEAMLWVEKAADKGFPPAVGALYFGEMTYLWEILGDAPDGWDYCPCRL